VSPRIVAPPQAQLPLKVGFYVSTTYEPTDKQGIPAALDLLEFLFAFAGEDEHNNPL
jgi:hypothetical protein